MQESGGFRPGVDHATVPIKTTRVSAIIFQKSMILIIIVSLILLHEDEPFVITGAVS